MLGLYYNRARYLNTTTGRFWSMDAYEGRVQDPLSLHKYLYAVANPVNGRDPSGRDFVETIQTVAVQAQLYVMRRVAHPSRFLPLIAPSTPWGAPSLRFLQGRVRECLQLRIYAARFRNEISVHP